MTSPSDYARALIASSEIIDLHIDTFIWSRLFGYDLTLRHGDGPFGGRFLGQVDLPRLREAHVTGAIWSITTNPFRSRRGRVKAFAENLRKLEATFAKPAAKTAIVRNHSEFLAARKKGLHAAFIGIQGGNALEGAPELLEIYGSQLIKVTLIHLLNSGFGMTSSPFRSGKDRGLTTRGREFISHLNRGRIFLDLAHISRRGFFEALEAHDRTQPFIVSHTGVSGVHPHWRNLDDEQIRAVADSGGTIGIMYQSSFLASGAPFTRAQPGSVLDHMEHVIRTAGEDYVSLGSDWDGLITPPSELETCLELPVLVQLMLDRKWSDTRIQKILSGNFLRTLKTLRP